MIAGPFLVGSGFRRNQAAGSPFTIAVNNAMPAGALPMFLWGSDASDLAECSLIDSAGNLYDPNVNMTVDPGTGFAMSVYVSYQTAAVQALPVGGTITLQCSERASYGGAMYYFTGAAGNIWAGLVKWSSEWGNTVNVNGQVPCLPGMSVAAFLAIAGPNNDVFNQDPNGWQADLAAGAGNFNATVHATARHNIASEGPVTYAPVLGAARRSVLCMMAFQ